MNLLWRYWIVEIVKFESLIPRISTGFPLRHIKFEETQSWAWYYLQHIEVCSKYSVRFKRFNGKRLHWPFKFCFFPRSNLLFPVGSTTEKFRYYWTLRCRCSHNLPITCPVLAASPCRSDSPWSAGLILINRNQMLTDPLFKPINRILMLMVYGH